MLPAQEWEFAPGPREIKVYIYYPGGDLEKVRPATGLMLCLHNWGGTGSDGAPDPVQVVNRYDVIAISVDYLQSGEWDPSAGAPYDFGYLQALDALRALHYVFQSLDDAKKPFSRGRIYATGGSGGGNVALMANKLAPRTFACIVDISGMAKLTDDIAFGLPGGSDLNAGYSQDKGSKTYLTRDAQELRFIGNAEHLATMRSLVNAAKVLVIHGVNDPTCPADDALRMVLEFKRERLHAVAHMISKADVDGDALTGATHSLGDRTKILFKFGDPFLLPRSRAMRMRVGKNDFELRDEEVRYATQNGKYIISYAEGPPVGRFVPSR